MKTANTGNDIKSTGRVHLLDEIRGFAIICMVVYHVGFLLKEFYAVRVPLMFDPWFYYVWAVFAGSFIFISGVACRYSRDNVRRGAKCFFLGMAVSYVTALAVPEVTILFGILHFMGVCMMLFGLCEKVIDKVPIKFGLPLCFLLMFATWNVIAGLFGFGGVNSLFTIVLPSALYESGLLFPLGFKGSGFSSGDYFPLMPWGFLYLGGAYAGAWLKAGNAPTWVYSCKLPVSVLRVAGRNTIWIYLAHQPVAMAVLYLLLGAPRF